MVQRIVDTGLPLNSMRLKLKELSNQRMILTGATSGIGLVTARMAAEKGVKLVLVARNEEALKQLTEELTQKGSEAVYVTADISSEKDIHLIEDKAIEAFGGYDTWVNNASVALYSYADDVPIEDARQLFDINFWGTVYGTRKAVAYFKEKGEPGAIITIGSVTGNRAFPLQTFYSSTKMAIHGFIDGLRMELEKARVPIVITQIHPARIDTPYTDHATSYIERHPAHNGIVYPPESVAEAILLAATQPKRDIYVGTQSKFFSIVGRALPRLVDYMMEIDTFKTNYDTDRKAKAPDAGNLYEPKEDLMERGSNLGWKRPPSLMVKAKKRPALSILATAGIGLAIYKALKK